MVFFLEVDDLQVSIICYCILCIFLVSTKIDFSPAAPIQMYRITITILVLFGILFVGCAAGPKLSPIQIRQITTKLINGAYEDTYRSALTVLKDQGYIVKNTDMESGLIMAQVDEVAYSPCLGPIQINDKIKDNK